MNKVFSLKAAIRGLACVLIGTTTLVFTVSHDGWAMLAPAESAGQPMPDGQRAADLKTVQKALESKILRERLKEFGLSDPQVQSRLDKLSDKEIHQLAGQIHTVNPGGDGGVIVGLLVIVVLVLLIIYLAKRV